MKLEELNKIYSDKVAELLNAGWVIYQTPTNCECQPSMSLVFKLGEEYRVVYINHHACDKNYQYHRAVRIGWGTPDLDKWVPEELLYIEDCREVTEHTYLEVGRSRGWYVTPQDFPAIIEKRQLRYNRKRRVGLFREFLGGKHEIPSPEACKAAQKLVRKVKGYGKTTLSGILRVWFESGTDGNWHCEPTLCIQVAGKPAEARIPMPCAR